MLGRNSSVGEISLMTLVSWLTKCPSFWALSPSIPNKRPAHGEACDSAMSFEMCLPNMDPKFELSETQDKRDFHQPN